MATARSIRITEMIEESISAGKKFTHEDMAAIQQDFTDVFARDMTPRLISIAEGLKSELSAKQASDFETMVEHLEGWTGLMDAESVPASVYSFTLMSVHKSLFHAYESDPEERMAFSDGSYLYVEFLLTLLKDVEKSGSKSKYQKVCS